VGQMGGSRAHTSPVPPPIITNTNLHAGSSVLSTPFDDVEEMMVVDGNGEGSGTNEDSFSTQVMNSPHSNLIVEVMMGNSPHIRLAWRGFHLGPLVHQFGAEILLLVA
jgi:hypothetical protein